MRRRAFFRGKKSGGEDFIFVVNTANTSSGSSASNQFRLPFGSFGTYDLTVFWGDGSSDYISSGTQPEITHTYSSIGTYTVTIDGFFNSFHFAGAGDRLKILDIQQWGNTGLFGRVSNSASGNGSFQGCSNLNVSATDKPNFNPYAPSLQLFFNGCTSLTGNSSFNTWVFPPSCTSLFGFFYGCSSFNQNIDNWDVSNITNFAAIFRSATSFNQPLNNWDVSNGIAFGSGSNNGMFQLSSFNQPLDNWNVSSATNMAFMFANTPFNQNINNWNVSNVTNFQSTFQGTPFNQPLNNWNVSSGVTFSSMFVNCSNFNQNIDSWNVSNGVAFNSMFANCISYNQPLNSWNVGNATQMQAMFYNCDVFNQPLNNWDVSKVVNFGFDTNQGMFMLCNVFNQDLSSWNVSSGKYFEQMFQDAPLFNSPLNTWNMISAITIDSMFSGTSFNQPLNLWNTSNITSMGSNSAFNGVFARCPFNQDISMWDVSKVTSFSRMFLGNTAFNQPLNSWVTTALAGSNAVLQMFSGATAFNQPLNNWNVSGVTSFGGSNNGMFQGASSFNQNLSAWNMSNAQIIHSMFSNCIGLTVPIQDMIAGWTLTALTDSRFCWSGCVNMPGNGQAFIDKPKAAGYTVGTSTANSSYRTFNACTTLTDFATIPAAYK